MYSTLMLPELAQTLHAARLAEADRRRQLRELKADRVRQPRAWHLPWPRYACVTVR